MEIKNISEETKVKRINTTLTSNIEDQTIMMNLEQGNYYGLNAVGNRIWELADQEISVKDICSALLKEYEVEEKHCKKVVLSFLGKMREAGLIIIS
jgi:hypothetical protein